MTTSRRTKKDVVSEFRCAEVLGSARKVFAKKGFSAATMDDIAAAAGLAKGTLYLYFKSKRDVYLKTLQQGIAELFGHVATNMQAAEGVKAKIRALVTTRVKYAEENRDFIKIYLTEFNGATQSAPINKELRDAYFKQIQAVELVLRDGVNGGDIPQLDVEAAAFMLQDMSKSLITRRSLGWSKKTVDEDIDFLCGCIWKVIGCK